MRAALWRVSRTSDTSKDPAVTLRRGLPAVFFLFYLHVARVVSHEPYLLTWTRGAGCLRRTGGGALPVAWETRRVLAQSEVADVPTTVEAACGPRAGAQGAESA